MDLPKYWNEDKGKIIKAIVSGGAEYWDELQKVTGFTEKYLNFQLRELFQTDEISKNEGIYKVSSELFKSYSRAEVSDIKTELERLKYAVEYELNQLSDIGYLGNKIENWIKVHEIGTSLEKDQLFLEGRYLDAFTKFILDRARSEIFVVNPFVDECDLSKTLIDAKKRGLKVKLLTRSPEDNSKKACHKKLGEEGIEIDYKNIHAKIIILDGEVAIISSMNFFSESSACKNWESGMITINRDIIGEIKKATIKQMS